MAQTQPGSLLYVNGLNASTGGYLEPPHHARAIARLILESGAQQESAELRTLDEKIAQGFATFAVRFDLDECDLSQTGWSVIFSHDADPEIRDALSPLLDLRREQAGDQYREYAGTSGHRPGESWESFRERHGTSPGFAVPAEMPYYTLIVGDPESIPYAFQRQLDLQRAVGRVHFGTLDEYESYARSVVIAERGHLHPPRRAVFFAPVNPDDPLSLSMRYALVEPLAEALDSEPMKQWQVSLVQPEEGTKAQLQALLGGTDTPSLLFAAAHGVGFDQEDPRAASHLGALVCQEWPGPRTWQVRLSERDHYFSADDVPADANLTGMMAILMATYSAGTPGSLDPVYRRADAAESTPGMPGRAVVSPLARRLLAHPRGGALALVGQVDRIWCASPGIGDDAAPSGRDLAAIKGMVNALTLGYPLGYAMESLNRRYAELNADLTAELQTANERGLISGGDTRAWIAYLWAARNNMRSYVVVGDPAARLPAATKRSASDYLSRETGAVVVPSVQAEGAATPPRTAEGPTQIYTVYSPVGAVPPAVGLTGQTAAEGAHIQGDSGPEAHDPSAVDSLRLRPNRIGSVRRRGLTVLDATDSDEAFRITLDSLMGAHNAALVLHWVLFLASISLFVGAGWLGAVHRAPLWGAAAAVAGASLLIAQLATWPSRSFFQDLQFVTWLGVVYNTYWARLAASSNSENADEALTAATRLASEQLEELTAKYAQVGAARSAEFTALFRRRR